MKFLPKHDNFLKIFTHLSHLYPLQVENCGSNSRLVASSLNGECAGQKFKNFCSSSLWICLHHMVILRTQNKITYFFIILSWLSRFNYNLFTSPIFYELYVIYILPVLSNISPLGLKRCQSPYHSETMDTFSIPRDDNIIGCFKRTKTH